MRDSHYSQRDREGASGGVRLVVKDMSAMVR